MTLYPVMITLGGKKHLIASRADRKLTNAVCIFTMARMLSTRYKMPTHIDEGLKKMVLKAALEL